MDVNNNSKNGGFTLVELLVVIAIMAVFTGAFALSFRMVGSQRVSNAASTTKQMVQVAQTYAKSKNLTILVFKKMSDGSTSCRVCTADSPVQVVNRNFADTDKKTEFNKNIKISVAYGDVSNYVELKDPGDIITVIFNKGIGKPYNLSYYETSAGSGTGTPRRIKFTNGSKTATLRIAQYTGAVSYE